MFPRGALWGAMGPRGGLMGNLPTQVSTLVDVIAHAFGAANLGKPAARANDSLASAKRSLLRARETRKQSLAQEFVCDFRSRAKLGVSLKRYYPFSHTTDFPRLVDP